MEFLKELSEAPLPVSIYQSELIDKVRSYVSAGLITASLPSELRTHSSAPTPAQVLKITAEGRRVLKNISNVLDGADLKRERLSLNMQFLPIAPSGSNC